MAKVKVTARFQILEFVDRFIDGTTANALGKTVVTESLKMISEGQSPVRGHGRFERYKDRKSYPGDLKPARPVNLNLTGEMLEGGFGFKVKPGNVIEIGMVRGSAERKEIAGYHHDGTPNMAQRRFVPGEGEEFAVSIMRQIRDLYSKRLANLIRQSNKKG